MTNSQIKKQLAKLQQRLVSLDQQIETTRLEMRHVRDLCKHPDKERWTNNDGDGQFVVERCKVCGMQKDGGLN